MRTIFSHPSQLFILTLLNSTLTGIRAEDNAYSVKILVKTAKAFKLPYTLDVKNIGRITLESVASKDNRGGLQVPASTEYEKDGRKDYTGTPILARFIPSSFEGYQILVNSQIAGLLERIEYLQKQNTVNVVNPIPVMDNPKTMSLNAGDTTAVDEDLPF